jgi:uncharacterized membrane protein
MKKLFSITLILFGLSVYAQAQEKAVPVKEYTVSLSENSIKLAPGESKQVTINLLRSKGFSNSEVKLGISSALPSGITIAYEPATGVFESSVATITASKEATEGQYQIILKSSIKNITKGSIVKVVVEGSSVPKDAVSLN